MTKMITLVLALCFSTPVFAGAGMHMPQRLNTVNLEQLEVHTDDFAQVHVKGWSGTELKKLNWGAEWTKVEDQQSAEIEFGYVWGIDPFWDAGPVLSIEREQEDDHSDTESWVGWQFKGTTPYFIHLDAKTLLASRQFKIDLDLSHEFPISKHYIIETRLELEAGRLEHDQGLELMVEQWQFGWRLRYETVDRLSYYVGVAYTDDNSEFTEKWRGLAGLSYWW